MPHWFQFDPLIISVTYHYHIVDLLNMILIGYCLLVKSCDPELGLVLAIANLCDYSTEARQSLIHILDATMDYL